MTLPETNRIRRHHEERWSMDCAADANFADMYLHPQETSYDLRRLFDLIESVGLEFVGFSNPQIWDPARLLSGELLERALKLPPRDRWSLVEQLDPDISHFEFFLSPGPVRASVWDDEALMGLTAIPQPCLWGEPDPILGRDMEPIALSAAAKNLIRRLAEQPGTPLGKLAPLELIRDLVERQVLLLTP